MAEARQNSTEWLRNRRRARERDGSECQNCGRDYDLQVHHILPVEKGGSHDLPNLVTLCNDCHWHLHRNEGRWDGDRLTLEYLGDYEPGEYGGWRIEREFSDTERAILRTVGDGKEYQRKEILKAVGASESHVTTKLQSLRISGYIKRVRRGVYQYRTAEESKRARENTDQ